jgi:hypothetical protein
MCEYDAEAHLATICLKFLRQSGYLEELDELLQKERMPEDWNLASYLLSRPFLAYAAEFWCSHLQAADFIAPTPELQLMHSRAIQIFDSAAYRLSLWRLYYFSRHSIDPGLSRPYKLQVAAHLKVPFLVEHYLSAGESATDGFPLVWASEGGNCECIEKLIKAGADVNEREFDGWSYLHWATTNGHEEACGLLIRDGAKTDVQDA